MADVPAQAWKNGGGLTREIVCWPPGAGVNDFLWRVSVARIDADGPFSRFADVDRVITLLSGPGVLLRGGFPSGMHALTDALVPFPFPGDVEVDCALQGGASEDFNVMSRRGAVSANVTVIRQDAELPPAAYGLLLAVGGNWAVAAAGGDDSGYTLPPDSGLWWARTGQTWRVRSAGGIRPAVNASAGLLAVTFDISAASRPTGGDAHASQARPA
nr:HutD family protein [Bordetella sp. LUAb4]